MASWHPEEQRRKDDVLGYVPIEVEGFVDERDQHEQEPTLEETMAVARFWWAVRQDLDFARRFGW